MLFHTCCFVVTCAEGAPDAPNSVSERCGCGPTTVLPAPHCSANMAQQQQPVSMVQVSIAAAVPRHCKVHISRWCCCQSPHGPLRLLSAPPHGYLSSQSTHCNHQQQQLLMMNTHCMNLVQGMDCAMCARESGSFCVCLHSDKAWTVPCVHGKRVQSVYVCILYPPPTPLSS